MTDIIKANDLIPLMRVEDFGLVLDNSKASDEHIQRAFELAGLSITSIEDKKGFLGVDQVWRVFSSLISILNDELLGQSTRVMPLGSVELAFASVAHAKTFSEALQRFAHAVNLIFTDLNLEYYRRHNMLHLNASFVGGNSVAQQVYLEIACIPWHCAFCWMTGEQLPLARFVTGPDRSGVKTQLCATFGCNVDFTGSGISLIYPASLAGIPINSPAIVNVRHGIYENFLENLTHSQRQRTQGSMTEYVKHAVTHGVIDQQQIASSAGMSVATLRRHLESEGVTFRQLTDEIQFENAAELINAGRSVEDIADLLGYSDGRSFRRAFIRMSGITPKAFREKTKI